MGAKTELIPRRSFIKTTAAGLAFGFGSLVVGQTNLAVEPEPGHLAEYRRQLLELVNIERGLANLAPVALDEFACQVATKHALDMAGGKFVSHWGSDGLSPYQRYSFAGGFEYSEENVSATEQIPSLKPERVAAELLNMNIRMHAETPPKDGHRRTILMPAATHAGFGIARNGDSLRMSQIFLSRYCAIEPWPRSTKLKAKLTIKGRLLDQSHVFQQADVFYEPLVAIDNIPALAGHSYSLPKEFVTLRPIVAVRVHYSDGSTGTIDVGSHGKFTIPLTLFKEAAGIYTVVIWIKRKEKEQAFPVSELCIRAG